MAKKKTPKAERVHFPGLSPRAYEHPSDRAALVALRRVPGFDYAVRKLFGFVGDRSLREHGDGAPCDRCRCMIVAVMPLAPQRDEDIAGLNASGILFQMTRAQRGHIVLTAQQFIESHVHIVRSASGRTPSRRRARAAT